MGYKIFYEITLRPNPLSFANFLMFCLEYQALKKQNEHSNIDQLDFFAQDVFGKLVKAICKSGLFPEPLLLSSSSKSCLALK